MISYPFLPYPPPPPTLSDCCQNHHQSESELESESEASEADHSKIVSATNNIAINVCMYIHIFTHGIYLVLLAYIYLFICISVYSWIYSCHSPATIRQAKSHWHFYLLLKIFWNCYKTARRRATTTTTTRTTTTTTTTTKIVLCIFQFLVVVVATISVVVFSSFSFWSKARQSCHQISW